MVQHRHYGSVCPLLKPAVYKARRQTKSQHKGQKGWYLGPAHNHSRDRVRMLWHRNHGTIIITRNFTWRHVPAVPAVSSTTPQLLPLAENEEDGEGEGSADVSSQGGGGDGGMTDLSESDLDVTEVSGPRHVTPPVRKEAPAEPGNGKQGTKVAFPRRPRPEGAT